MRKLQMSKLFATLLAAVFAAATVTPVIAQDKKDAPKAEAKKEDGKAVAAEKKADGKGDAKKADGKAKADDKKADSKGDDKKK
jgi:hypothetical protein